MNRPHRRSMKNSLLDAAQNQIGASYGRAQQLAAQKARHERRVQLYIDAMKAVEDYEKNEIHRQLDQATRDACIRYYVETHTLR